MISLLLASAAANQSDCRKCDRDDFLMIPECHHTGWMFQSNSSSTIIACRPLVTTVWSADNITLLFGLLFGAVAFSLAANLRRRRLQARLRA
jgi:hypothetical protein